MATIPALPFTGLALRNALVAIDGEVAGKATPADITAAVATKADAVHPHAIADTTGLQSALDGKAEVSHTHTIGNVTGLQAALDTHTHSWSGITDKPAVIAAGATQADARTAIGAGTSSLVLGTTASTAKAGNYAPTWAQVTGKPALAPLTPTVNAQTGTAYTLALSDAGAIVTLANGAANTVTVPTNSAAAFPVGTIINVMQLGAGRTTVTGAAGVSVNGTAAGSVDTAGQWEGVALTKIGTDAWVVSGGAA